MGTKNLAMGKEKFLQLIQEKNIHVNSIELLNKLLSKLNKEIKLLHKILEYLINRSKERDFSFSIKVYPSNRGLENLHFVIHLPKESGNNKEYKEKAIFELVEHEYYRETIDKQNLLWFVDFIVTNKEMNKKHRDNSIKSELSSLKLTIELVPSSSWYNNLRKVLSQSEWDKIRKQTYAKYNYQCGICGSKGRLECHEIWEYDDINHIQKLKGFIALCHDCHMIKHIGFAGIQAGKGLLDMDKLIEHFMKVNNVDRETFEEHKEHAFEQWEIRSCYQWHVDLGEYEKLVHKKDNQHIKIQKKLFLL